MSALAGLSFAEPAWWLAALIPIMYLLFAQTLQRARLQAIGSLALWRAVLETRSSSAARRAVNWRSLALAFSMLVCVAAMAGPRWEPKQGPKRWHLVFGTGAAGRLASDATDATDASGGTRLDAALREAQAFVESQAPDDQFVFVGASPALDRRATATQVFQRATAQDALDDAMQGALQWTVAPTLVESPTSAWQAAALAAPERADWAAWDRGDSVWFPVTPLERAPVRAGVWQAAWADAPGRVGVRGSDWMVWTGAELATEAGATPWVLAQGAIWQAHTEAGRVLAALCATRGYQLVRAPFDLALPDGDPLLVLWQAGALDDGDLQIAAITGTGWSAEWSLRRAAAPPTSTPVLSAGAGADEPAIAWEPGLVWTRAKEMGAVSGPLANAVVDWTELLERAMRLPDASVVPMASRQAASAERRSPKGWPVLPSPTPLGAPVAGVAILLLLVFLRR